MKKVLLSLSLVFGLVTASYAAVPVPRDGQNLQIANPAWAGASVCDIDNSTSTRDVLCASSRGVILGVIASTFTTVTNVIFRDSTTANHSVLPLFGMTFTTATTLTPQAGQSGGTLFLVPGGVFPKFSNGLVVMSSTALDAGSGRLDILYRLQSDQN